MHFLFQFPSRRLPQWPGVVAPEDALGSVVKEVDQNVKDDDEKCAKDAEKKPNVH